ncbi:MAG: sugar phosphate isomerase/epimerase [Candidatus Hinthialibacter antarcticus]|nr:sugar phosphate isomerase/epimerase [Candidatus Hinthialibacter antarcticus]
MKDALQRRQFLAAGATAAFAASAGLNQSAFAAPSTTANEPKIGLILYTLRDFLKTGDDIARTFEKIKKIGYNNVEITSCGAVSNSELAKLLKANELNAVSTHSSFDQMRNDLNKVVDEHKEIGCSHICVGSMPGDMRKDKASYIEFAKQASEVGQNLAEHNMTFGYHNHNFEFHHFDGIAGQEVLRTESDPKAFNFEIDTYWIQAGGADPAQWIEKTAGRVPTVHMKDMLMLDGKQVFAEVGAGNLNWPAILDAIKKAKPKYVIVEQDQCYRDHFESITLSIKNMKSWGLKA